MVKKCVFFLFVLVFPWDVASSKIYVLFGSEKKIYIYDEHAQLTTKVMEQVMLLSKDEDDELTRV